MIVFTYQPFTATFTMGNVWVKPWRKTFRPGLIVFNSYHNSWRAVHKKSPRWGKEGVYKGRKTDMEPFNPLYCVKRGHRRRPPHGIEPNQNERIAPKWKARTNPIEQYRLGLNQILCRKTSMSLPRTEKSARSPGNCVWITGHMFKIVCWDRGYESSYLDQALCLPDLEYQMYGFEEREDLNRAYFPGQLSRTRNTRLGKPCSANTWDV